MQIYISKLGAFETVGTYYESPDKWLHFMQVYLQRNVIIWLAKLYEYEGRQSEIRIRFVIARVRSTQQSTFIQLYTIMVESSENVPCVDMYTLHKNSMSKLSFANTYIIKPIDFFIVTPISYSMQYPICTFPFFFSYTMLKR